MSNRTNATLIGVHDCQLLRVSLPRVVYVPILPGTWLRLRPSTSAFLAKWYSCIMLLMFGQGAQFPFLCLSCRVVTLCWKGELIHVTGGERVDQSAPGATDEVA